MMRLTVASGKGGTGKTTLAVNLALSIENAMLIDCDVEGPNCHIFFREPMSRLRDVSIPAPIFDLDKCTLCAKCADFCRYNAIAVISDRLLFFEQLCHGCGGCKLVCQAGAIGETEHHVGVIEKGGKPDLPLYHGMLDIGQPFGVPIIRDLKSLVNNHGTVIFDSPPGTACPAVEAMRDADYCILVTEPTPFGLHDLKLTVDVVRELDIPFGVVINRDGIGDDRVEKYCSEESIALLAKIPNDIRIARLYSKGVPIVEGLPVFQQLFMEIFERAREAV